MKNSCVTALVNPNLAKGEIDSDELRKIPVRYCIAPTEEVSVFKLNMETYFYMNYDSTNSY